MLTVELLCLQLFLLWPLNVQFELLCFRWQNCGLLVLQFGIALFCLKLEIVSWLFSLTAIDSVELLWLTVLALASQ